MSNDADRAAALAALLVAMNTRTYLAKLQEMAHLYGLSPPTALTDTAAIQGIAERAAVSADSIIGTQDDRRAALEADADTPDQAQMAYSDWHQQQSDMIARYETSVAAAIAFDAFTSRNGLTGYEQIEPTMCTTLDQCSSDIGLGQQKIGTFGFYPMHPHCYHAVVRYYDAVQDPSGMWTGGSA